MYEKLKNEELSLKNILGQQSRMLHNYICDLEIMLINQIYDKTLIPCEDLLSENINFEINWKTYTIYWDFTSEENMHIEPWLCGDEYDISKCALFKLLVEDGELMLEIDEDNINESSNKVVDGKHLIKQYGKCI